MILGIFTLLFLWYHKIYQQKESASDEYPRFTKVPIVAFGVGNIPYLDVEIENKDYTFAVDLGATNHAAMVRESLLQLKKKSYVKNTAIVGLNGKEYQEAVYRIPSIKIGRFTLRNSYLNEEYEKSGEITTIIPPEETVVSRAGTLGSSFFSLVCLFLDVNRSTIALCDNAETFKSQGYSLNNFIKIPFSYDHQLIEFEMTTLKGCLRCFIDSGCTYNFINTLNIDNMPLEKLIKDEKNYIHFSNLWIGGKDFGEITFRPLLIKFPFKVDTILGMEFLFHHQVFIDFPNQEIYFCPSSATYDPSEIHKTAAL